jgi:predicted secreted protein
MVSKRVGTRLIALFFALSVITACGGGSSSPPPVGPPDIPNLTGGEGSSTSPISVVLNTPRSSTVGSFDDSYYTFTTTAAGTYVISLTNPTTDVSWDLYSNADFTGYVESCDNYWSTAAEQCTATLQAGRAYYLRVSEFSLSTGTFTLAISLITSEGSTTSPIDLTVGTSHAGTVGLSGISYYRFQPVNSVAHTIAISNSVPNYSGLTFKVYSTDFTSSSPVLLKTCGSSYNPSCTVNGLSAGLYYYVEVDGNTYSAVRYDITVTEGLSEGSLSAPLELIVGAPAHVGAVDATSTSFYKFTTTATAGEYILTLSGSTAPYIYAYSGSDFSTGSIGSCSPSQPCKLFGLDAMRTYYVKITNSTSSAVTYQISVAQGVTEGSANDPVALTVDAAAHNAVIDASGASYYFFQTTTVSGSYTVSLTNTQRNLGWTLYNDAAFTYSIGSCNKVTTTGAGDEVCPTTNLDSSRTYYLKVINYESTGSSTYGVAVATGGGSEGSRNNPMLISGLTHTGSILSSGHSYYSFTTGSKAVTYVIGLANMQSDLSWTLYSDSAFSYSVLSCNRHPGTIAAETCSTQDSYSTPLLSAGTTYYLDVYNWGASQSTYNLSLMPLDPSAGCSGSAVECFNFENGLVPAGFNLSNTGGLNGNQWKWGIDSVNSAGTGTNSMMNGPINYPYSTCFDYTPAAKPNSMAFSLRTDTSNPLDAYIVIDGSTLSLGSWGGTTPWRRVFYDTTIYTGTTFKFQWCYKRNFNYTSVTETVWVDDIEFK